MSCTWTHCDPTLPVWLHQRLRINLLPHPDIPASLTVIPNTHTHTHTGVQYRAGETPGCVCLFLVRRRDPVAERPIWNGTWSSILVYRLQCYGQPVCLSACLFVCLTVCPTRRREVGCVGALLLQVQKINTHTHIWSLSSYDVTANQ